MPLALQNWPFLPIPAQNFLAEWTEPAEPTHYLPERPSKGKPKNLLSEKPENLRKSAGVGLKGKSISTNNRIRQSRGGLNLALSCPRDGLNFAYNQTFCKGAHKFNMAIPKTACNTHKPRWHVACYWDFMDVQPLNVGMERHAT